MLWYQCNNATKENHDHPFSLNTGATVVSVEAKSRFLIRYLKDEMRNIFDKCSV